MGILTDRGVKAAKTEGKHREIPDGQDGLYLVVYPSGKKSWCIRYRNSGGKTRKITLGQITRISLADARKMARLKMVEIDSGHDPAAQTTASLLDRTVKGFADGFIAWGKVRNRTWTETQRQFTAYILPAIGEKQIGDVSKADVRTILDDLKSRGSPYMANRVFASLQKFFNWSVEHDFLETSPCKGLKKPCDETSRARVLSWSEVAVLWSHSAHLPQPFGPIVRLLILTGQRRGEVTGIADTEIDRNRSTWTIPADRAKNGKEHTVPLSQHSVATLEDISRIGKTSLYFTTNGKTAYSGHQKAKTRLDAALQFNAPWRLHDLRRTFATGMAELGEPVHVVEALLNHTSGTLSGVAGVYNRHEYTEEKRHAISAWTRFISDIVTDDELRLIYESMDVRKPFREAIHAGDETWLEYVSELKGFRL